MLHNEPSAIFNVNLEQLISVAFETQYGSGSLCSMARYVPILLTGGPDRPGLTYEYMISRKEEKSALEV